jgi:nucleotidyltransferase/DNA polymerase involved in DNA repair
MRPVSLQGRFSDAGSRSETPVSGNNFRCPGFRRYREVSRRVREIFKRHTDPIEPLSLDAVYLDVTENTTGLPTAIQVARTTRVQSLRLPTSQ